MDQGEGDINTPEMDLHLAAFHNTVDVVQMLLDEGDADVNEQD